MRKYACFLIPIVVIFLLCWIAPSVAQTGKDRIVTTESVEYMLKTAEQLRSNRKLAESICTVRQAIDGAKYLNNRELIIKSKSFLARVYCSMDSLTLARKTIDSCLAKVHRESNVAGAYLFWAKANLENYLDNNAQTFGAIHKAMDLLKNERNEDWLKAKLLYLEYLVYSNIGDWEKALASVLKSLDFSVKIGDRNHQSICYTSIASVYKNKYRLANHQEDIIIAKKNLDKAYSLYQAHKESISPYTQAIVCNNLADIHSVFIKNTALSAKYLEEALHFAQQSNNQYVIAAASGTKSHIAIQNGHNEKAEHLLLSAFARIKESALPDLEILSVLAQDLSAFYEKNHQPAKALQYQKELSAVQKQLFDQQALVQVRKLEAVYQAEQQAAELENAKRTNRQHQIIISLCLLAALLTAVALFFMWRTKKLTIEEMHTQKQHDDLQLKLEQEENKRITVEKQLAEIEKNNLKKALLAGKLQIEHKNKVLKNIDKNLSEGQDVKVKKIIRKEARLDNDFSLIQRQIINTHPHFFDALKTYSSQQLTPLDMKICSYLLLEMDTKQIAGLLNITPKSVLMTKYRIKLKLNLPENVKLDKYIKNLI